MTKRKILAAIASLVAITTLSGCFVPMVNKNSDSTEKTNSTNSSVPSENI